MRGRLEELGVRVEGKERTLHSGLKSTVFWNIEKLLDYPEFVRRRAIEQFIWEVGKVKPAQIIGIPTGGYGVAFDLSRALSTRLDKAEVPVYQRPAVLVDDVLTTGRAIRAHLRNMRGHVETSRRRDQTFSGEWKPDYIAVLVNRSGMNELDGIPVISGIKADEVSTEDRKEARDAD